MHVDSAAPQDKADPATISSAHRIHGALPRMKSCLAKGAKSVALVSRSGHDGIVVVQYSMAPVARVFEEKLSKSFSFCANCVGEDVVETCPPHPPTPTAG